MVPWKSRRKQASYSRLLRQVSEHDAVWTAEKVVGTAWMATLDESEQQAATAHRVCSHMRDTASEVHRSAELEGDAARLSETHRALDESEQALDHVRDQHDRLREFAERERACWEQARRIRTLEILADRDRLAAAATVAGKPDERR